jgi:hypothetical protein
VPLVVEINGIHAMTDFYDTDDFYTDSDYMPVLIDNNIFLEYELY